MAALKTLIFSILVPGTVAGSLCLLLNASRQVSYRTDKAFHWRAHNPCANLPYTWKAVSYTGVDDWQQILAHDLANINAQRCPTEVQWRQLILVILSYRNVVHFQRVLQRIGGRATDELYNGWSSRHSECTDTCCLRNGAIANIRVGILLRKTTKVQSFD